MIDVICHKLGLTCQHLLTSKRQWGGIFLLGPTAPEDKSGILDIKQQEGSGRNGGSFGGSYQFLIAVLFWSLLQPFPTNRLSVQFYAIFTCSHWKVLYAYTRLADQEKVFIAAIYCSYCHTSQSHLYSQRSPKYYGKSPTFQHTHTHIIMIHDHKIS